MFATRFFTAIALAATLVPVTGPYMDNCKRTSLYA